MDDGRQNKRNMKKKLFKYTIRIVSGLFTLLWGLVAWAIIACASLLMFCLVWYATMDKRTANEKSPQ